MSSHVFNSAVCPRRKAPPFQCPRETPGKPFLLDRVKGSFRNYVSALPVVAAIESYKEACPLPEAA